MTYAIHLKADYWNPYLSPAYVFPMSKEEAEITKNDYDEFCDKRYTNDIIRNQAKQTMTVIQFGEQAND